MNTTSVIQRETGAGPLAHAATWFLWATLVALTSASPARAQIQTGPFQPGQGFFLFNSLPGVAPPGIGATTIDIDTDADGVPDTTFNLPPEVRPTSQLNVEFRLSPSQGTLYARVYGGSGQPCPTTGEVRVYLYRIGASPTLTPFTGDQGLCIDSPINIPATFHDTIGAPIRTMALVSAIDGASGNQALLWADLVGGEVNVDFNTYSAPINRIWFAPSGNAAFVVHNFNQVNKRYSLIDLCVSPIAGTGSIGTLPLGGSVEALVAAGGPTGFQMFLRENGLDVPTSVIDLDVSCHSGGPGDVSCCLDDGTCADVPAADCTDVLGGVPGAAGSDCASTECPRACCDTGSCSLQFAADCSAAGGTPFSAGVSCSQVTCPEACCFYDGSCSEVDPAFCSGAPQGPGSSCATATCPALNIAVTLNGPSFAVQGSTATFTIDWANTTSVTGPFMNLDFLIPQSAQVLSISNNGQLAFNNTRVRWIFPSVPGSASGQETVTLRMPCFGTSGTSRAEMNGGGLSFSSGTVTTNYGPPNTTPVDVTVTSVTGATQPLVSGDVVTHTITLTNTGPQNHDVLKLSFGPGTDFEFDQLLDPGSGVATSFTPTFLQWEGSLAGNGSTQIQLTTTVADCIRNTSSALGNGTLDVRHQCNQLLGNTSTTSFGLLRSFETDLSAVNLGTPATLEAFNSNLSAQFVRVGGRVEMEWTLTNPQGFSQSVDAWTILPDGVLDAGAPIFLPPVVPGVSFDLPTRRVLWSGTLAPQQTLTIRFEVTANQTVDCSYYFSADLGDASCRIRKDHVVSRVADRPAQSHLIGMSEQGLVWTLRPDLDTDAQNFTCVPMEIATGLGLGANGDLWITGLPTLMVNLDTLDADGMTLTEVAALDSTFTTDAVVDPVDDRVYLSGISFGAQRLGRLKKFDRLTRSVTTIYEDPAQGTPPVGRIDRLDMGPDGKPAAIADRSKLVRFDPAAPGTFSELSDPTFPDPISLTIDVDGDYVVSSGAFTPTARPLSEVDPGTGAFTEIAADLNSVFPSAPLENSAIGDAGEVYLAPDYVGTVYRVHRTGPATFDVAAAGSFSTVDLVWVSGATCNDSDGDGYFDVAGCGGGGVDCDDANAAVFPGAAEINDGLDNQCPGETGFGAIDEVQSLTSSGMNGGSPEYCWDPQSGATGYEVVRSTTPDFSSGCTRSLTPSTCWTDTQPGQPGELIYYLVRTTSPFPGSWGLDGSGVERTVICP